MLRSTRVQRVESELLEILTQYLLHEISEPLPCYASITAVETQGDLRHAKVYFRLVGDGPSVQEGERILSFARGDFQKHVAHSLKTKFCPVLRFEFGVAPNGGDEIDRLLAALRRPKHLED